MAIEKIVVVDDEMMIRKAFRDAVANKTILSSVYWRFKRGSQDFGKRFFDFGILDLRLPDGEGTDLLEEVMAKTDGPMVVMMTGYGSVESAVSCMQLGAFDYVVKPFSLSK